MSISGDGRTGIAAPQDVVAELDKMPDRALVTFQEASHEI